MSYRSCPGINGMSFIVNGRIDVDTEGVVSLCCENRPVPRMSFSGSPEEILTNFFGLRTRMLTESVRYTQNNTQPNSEHCISGCLGCVRYSRAEWHPSMQINSVNLSMYPAPCQCKCIYCGAQKWWSNDWKITAAYEKLFDTLELAESSELIAHDAKWQVSTGEITIHPLEISRDESIKYRLTVQERIKLLGAVSYLVAMCRTNNVVYNLSPFSLEEQTEISGLSDEILSTGQV